VSMDRPGRVPSCVVRNRQEPWTNRIAMEPHIASAPPCLKKDDTGEVLCDRPRRCSPEAVVIHGIGMSLKQLTIRTAIVIASTTPEFIIRRFGVFGPHNCIMSGKPDLVPVGWPLRWPDGPVTSSATPLPSWPLRFNSSSVGIPQP